MSVGGKKGIQKRLRIASNFPWWSIISTYEFVGDNAHETEESRKSRYEHTLSDFETMLLYVHVMCFMLEGGGQTNRKSQIVHLRIYEIGHKYHVIRHQTPFFASISAILAFFSFRLRIKARTLSSCLNSSSSRSSCSFNLRNSTSSTAGV